ncbi:MAG: hypothetical protein OXH75_15605 [Acidobacteria bacterium]|nr:hypothetical protein [Acidobacteriota bacterium]
MLTRDQMNELVDEAVAASAVDLAGVDYIFCEHESYRSISRPVSTAGIHLRFASRDTDLGRDVAFAHALGHFGGDSCLKRLLEREGLAYAVVRRRVRRRTLLELVVGCIRVLQARADVPKVLNLVSFVQWWRRPVVWWEPV